VSAGHAPRRRSVYADRLLEFPAIVFSDGAEFTRRGKWRGNFPDTSQLVFEIGCNDAAFLTTVAAKHPTTAFIGIDWKCRALHTAATRVAELNLRNVALLHGRAQDIRCFFADSEVDEIWLFHPDPCDKPHELPNRLFAAPFLRDAYAVLRPGGLLVLKTDHRDYYEHAVALAGSVEDAFHVTASSPDFWTDPGVMAHTSGRPFAGELTTFEQRFRRKHKPIHYLELNRI
jgi:tRNA (guanine-N7-)-methyltransferase